MIKKSRKQQVVSSKEDSILSPSTFRLSAVRGFTLIELLVSVSIFVGILTIATGALFSAQVINTRLEQTQTILDGLHLATEVVVRDMRYGSMFYCDTVVPAAAPTSRRECSYPSGGTVIAFKPTVALPNSTSPEFDRVAYYLSDGVLYKREYPYGAPAQTKQITSTDVNIESFSLYTTGVYPSTGTSFDYNQPLITLVMSGVTVPRRADVEPVRFNVQTSAASRTLDQ